MLQPPFLSAKRSPRCRKCFAVVLFLLGLLASQPLAREDKPAVKPRLHPAGIDGALVICGGGKMPDAVLDHFMELAGGAKAHLVLIPTASETADKEPAEKLLERWQSRKPASAVVLHTRSRQTADDPKFLEPLKKATGVWFGGGVQSRITDAYLGTGVEKELYALLQRGGVIGGTSAGAAVMSKRMIASGNPEAKMSQGFDLLPGSVIDQHFLKRDRTKRLFGVLEKDPGLVGFGIDEGTALIVRGRQLRVLGDSTVTVCLAGTKERPPRTVELKSGAVADLTALRRSALARTEAPFPPKEVPVPEVPKGSLVIVGGGGLPDDVVKKFLELVGGPEALIVVLPTASPDPIPTNAGAGFLQKAGAKNVKVLPARELKDVEDLTNLDVLKQAKGIWFGGGRQWRFVDAYEGTKAHELFRDVLRRGGVIGGSSAGATIQGDYLCRGSPLNNTDMICEGYERGLGFLPGVAIDQHFTQRKRFADMTALMKTYPQLLGIGIDEATALVVQGHVGQVMGRGQVHFYDRKKPVEEGKPDYESVKAGGRYDLKAREALPTADKK
jgi:cyanophycinase